MITTSAAAASPSSADLVGGGIPVFGSDLAPRRSALEIRVVRAPFARALLKACDPDAARAVPGVQAVILADDLPGARVLAGDWGGLPVLADREILYFGQAVALVAALTREAADRAIAALAVAYQPLPPVFGLEEAFALHSFHGNAVSLDRGDIVAAMATAAHTMVHTFEMGGQERDLPEPAWAQAEPEDGGVLHVTTPCAPSPALLAALSAVLGLPMSALRLSVPAHSACPVGDPLPSLQAALVAHATGRSAWIRHSPEEQRMLAPRYPGVRAVFDVGFDERGGIVALDMAYFIDAGCAAVGGEAAIAGVLHHLDGVYGLPAARLAARLCRSHLAPCAADTGVLAARAQLAVELIVARIARTVGVLPEVVRQRNFPVPAEGEAGGTCLSVGGVPLRCEALVSLWKHALKQSEFSGRRKEVDAWNAGSPLVKRGIAALPAKLGLGEGRPGPSRSSAFLQVYPDASVRVSSDADTPALRQAVIDAVVAGTGARPASVRLAPVTGSRGSPELAVPSATAAARRLREKLLPLIMRIFHENGATGVLPENLRFSPGRIADGIDPNLGFSFESLVAFARAQGTGLSATGTSVSPSYGIPFHGYLAGTAVVEVEVDSFTGGTRILRADLYHESSPALAGSAATENGLRGTFMEGVGWLTTEKCRASVDGNARGAPPVSAPLAPGLDEEPLDFRVDFLEAVDGGGGNASGGGHALALGVREALRDAIAAFGAGEGAPFVDLPVPADPEAVFRLIQQQRAAGTSPQM